jgi:hypothetical protein
MKIIFLKKSILLIRINPEDDCCKCLFIFLISWNAFKFDVLNFDFEAFTMKQIKEFYVNLANDWNRKYRI